MLTWPRSTALRPDRGTRPVRMLRPSAVRALRCSIDGCEGRVGLGYLPRLPQRRNSVRERQEDHDERRSAAVYLLFRVGRRTEPGHAGAFYQADVPYTLSGFTTLEDGSVVPLEAPHRVTPDISMVGDPYTGFMTGETYTITGDPILDVGCVKISKTNEYCEESIGGTSLSSPLFAGVLALVNQARFQHHKHAVGFVNPALYLLNVGEPGATYAPIIDVKAPKSATAVLRGYLGDPTRVRWSP